jgi:hypothetical protein
MQFEILPNFFIIGAAKAGTTSLFNILNSHSQVFGSPVKETNFFSNDEKFQKGYDWYQNSFFQNASTYPVRMEASPAYLTWSTKTAPHFKEAYKSSDVKFAAIFRDPVQRAYSHYWHRVRLGHEDLSFEDAIQTEQDRLHKNWDELYRTGNGKYGYFRAGCYASRLHPFLEHFDRSRFIFLLQDDLLPKNFPDSINRLLHFLKINEVEKLSSERSNEATLPRNRWFIKMYWALKQTFLKPLYRQWAPQQFRKIIRGYLFPPSKYPPMNEDFERKLRLMYLEEIQQLEQVIDRELSSWLPT